MTKTVVNPLMTSIEVGRFWACYVTCLNVFGT